MENITISRAHQTTISIHTDTAARFRRIVEGLNGKKGPTTDKIISWWCDQTKEVQMWTLGMIQDSENLREVAGRQLKNVAESLISHGRDR